jgi:hypothetical protein
MIAERSSSKPRWLLEVAEAFFLLLMGAAERIAPLGKQYGGGEHIGRDDLVEQAGKLAIG